MTAFVERSDKFLFFTSKNRWKTCAEFCGEHLDLSSKQGLRTVLYYATDAVANNKTKLFKISCENEAAFLVKYCPLLN